MLEMKDFSDKYFDFEDKDGKYGLKVGVEEFINNHIEERLEVTYSISISGHKERYQNTRPVFPQKREGNQSTKN